MSKPQENQDFTWDQNMHNVNIAKDEFVDPLDNTLNGLLPKTPVKVGSTWSYLPFPNAAILTKVKVEKVEVIQGIECLKLVIDTPSGNPGDKSDFLVWLDPVTGMYVRCELHTKGNMNGMVSINDFVQTLKK